MKYLLDTNICIYLIKGSPQVVVDRLAQLHPSDLGVSAITAGELRTGAEKSQHPSRNHRVLDAFLGDLVVVPFDAATAGIYAEVRAKLERRGKPIGDLDTLIAATALQTNTTLVTNNLREFQRVPRLRCENWAAVS